jgi:RHS repeat-associated protein
VTSDAGSIDDESDYYPFGEERAIVSSGINTYKFTGKERDSETGLDYFGARYYRSSTSRWLSSDWAMSSITVPYANFGDPQTLNLYSYTRNNPMSHADADGHCPWCVVVVVGALTAYKGAQAYYYGKEAQGHAEALVAEQKLMNKLPENTPATQQIDPDHLNAAMKKDDISLTQKAIQVGQILLNIVGDINVAAKYYFGPSGTPSMNGEKAATSGTTEGANQVQTVNDSMDQQGQPESSLQQQNQQQTPQQDQQKGEGKGNLSQKEKDCVDKACNY